MPRDRRPAAARSRDDRAVCRASRARAGRAVRRGAGAVRRRRAGDGRGDRDRRHQGARPTPTATARWTTSRLAEAIVEEAIATDAAEDALLGERAATSCPRSSPAEGPPGLAARRRASGSTSDAPSRREPIPRSRPSALHGRQAPAGGRAGLERRANEAYEAYRARGRDEERPPLRPAAAQALHAARHAGRQGQPHRPRLQAGARHARLGPGLQRPSGLQRAAPDRRRRGHDRLTGLRAPRPDGRRRPPRAGRRRRHRAARRWCSPTPATGIWSR